MSLSHTETPDPVIDQLSGELDLSSTWALSALDEAVTDHPHTQVLVDLSNVTFLDSCALDAFARAHNQAIASGGSLTLHGATSSARKLLRICHLERMLPDPDPHDPAA